MIRQRAMVQEMKCATYTHSREPVFLLAIPPPN
jgi:hypothetical protein